MRHIFFLIVFSLIYSCLLAQVKAVPLVTGNFKDLKVEDFVRQLETQTGYRFYFEQKQFDSVQINLWVKDQPLQKVLSLAFDTARFHFSIDEHNNVFLLKDRMIRTELPVGFFERTPVNDSLANNIADVFLADNTKPVSASLENKLYEIGTKNSGNKTDKATIAGYVRDDKTREPLPGVTIYLEENAGVGIVTDRFGYFSLTLSKGLHTLNIQSIGKKDARRHILLYSDGKLDIELHDQIISLREVVISSKKVSNVRSTQLGVEKLNISTIKQVPTVFGEADVLRVVLNVPGVKSVGEAGAGFNVRGGATDQNLILFNGTTIYNPTHFFGFFSALNTEIIKDVQLYKSSMPAKYGGRLSSVL